MKQISAEFARMNQCSGALQDLVSHGASMEDICVVVRNGDRRDRFADEHGSRQVPCAFVGAIVGGVIGALYSPRALRFLAAGIPRRLDSIPLRMRWLHAMESILGGFIGWGLGGIMGGLIPREEARLNRFHPGAGGVLLTVAAPTVDDSQVEDVLQQHGGTISPVQIAGYGQQEAKLSSRRISA